MPTQVTVELDDDTLRDLRAYGDPGAILSRLATSVAGSLHDKKARRAKTDESLNVERSDVDLRLGEPPVEETREAKNQLLASERATTDRDLSGERGDTDQVLFEMREANQQMVSTTLQAKDLADQAAAAKDHAETRARELHEMAELRELFIGILGHDLRTPLSAINISAERLLRRGGLAPEDQLLVGRIIHSDERMARMIPQLLDLTRARLGGGLPLTRVAADLRKICESTAEEFDAPIERELEGDLTGTWDPDRLVQAVGNLLRNALEHATPGTPVRLAARSEGDGVVVEVSNQGPPIPPEMLPVIFEPFRRARQAEKSPGGNLGLGLYITREITLSHGGTLGGRSSGGVTTFTMRLPRTPPAAS
jgi:signal transduction histidine kinase